MRQVNQSWAGATFRRTAEQHMQERARATVAQIVDQINKNAMLYSRMNMMAMFPGEEVE